MEKVNWSEVVFEDGESVESLIRAARTAQNAGISDGSILLEEADRRARGLDEYRRTGGLPQMFLAALPGQSTDPANAHLAGPRPAQIDWSGFDLHLHELREHNGVVFDITQTQEETHQDERNDETASRPRRMR